MSTAALQSAFNAESGGAVCTRAELSYVNDMQVVVVRGVDAKGEPFEITSHPFDGEPMREVKKLAQRMRPSFDSVFQQNLDSAANQINRAHKIVDQIIHDPLPVRKPMGKLAEAAERIRAAKKKLDAEGDALIAKLGDLEGQAPGVFNAAHGAISAQKADLDALESELRQLSNAAMGE
jgi:cell pole-organizing protein PopZ